MQNTTYEWYTKDGQKEIRDNKSIAKKLSKILKKEIIIMIVLCIFIAVAGSTFGNIEYADSSGEIELSNSARHIVMYITETVDIAIIMGAPIVIAVILLTVLALLIATDDNKRTDPIYLCSKISTVSFVIGIFTLIVCPIFVITAEGWDGLFFAFPMFAAIYGALPIAFISFIVSICLKEQQKHRKRIGEKGTEESLVVDKTAAYEWYTKSGEREIRDNEKVIKMFSLAIIAEFAVAFLLFIFNQLRATDELSTPIITCFYAVLGVGMATVISRFIITRTYKVGPIQSLSTFSSTTFVLSIATLIGRPMFFGRGLGLTGIVYGYPMFAVILVMLPIVAISLLTVTHLKEQQKHRKKIYENTHQNEQGEENTDEDIRNC